MAGCFENKTGIVLSNSFSCPLGYYCPNIVSGNTSTLPTQCNPSSTCSSSRLLGSICFNAQPDHFGAQGLFEPVVCPPKYYCATPRTLDKCPQGYFCPTGTYKPRPCNLLASCPTGSASQTSFTGVVSFVVIDFFLLILYFVLQRRDRQKSIANTALPTSVAASSKIGNTDAQTIQDANLQRQKEMQLKQGLALNFQSSMNGKDLRMHFEMEQLGFKLPAGKEILKGVTGQIHAGRMTAIMGPSGAGKTTFLNVLCGKVKRTSGALKISGKEAEMQAFKKICGFVPQEDVMLRELTVRENILHSARIRAPKSWSAAQVEAHVDTLIEALNLSHVSHSVIGDGITRGVSGGQRKRVNIGMEVAATPLSLFLDEPTSGLDSTSSLEVMDMLDQIAKIGMTVVAVIHQPRVEIFQKFDDVLMIAPGGRTAYLGPTRNARPYFEKLGYEVSHLYFPPNF